MRQIVQLTEASKEDLPDIYCDLDEVLVDFLTGAKDAVGADFASMPSEERWKILNNTKGNNVVGYPFDDDTLITMSLENDSIDGLYPTGLI